MSCEIVIARYNENLDWVNKLDPSIKVTIYNKGLNDINFPFITLPNVGRETHTYLYHIIHNYKSLADQTIFCQGNTISHSPDFLKLLKVREQFEPIQSLSAYYSHGAQNIPSTEMKKLTTHLHINNLKVHVEYVDNDFITQYPMYEYDSGNIQNMKKFMKSVNTDNILKYTIKRLKLINVNDKDLFPFSYAAIFSVNKNVILNNSKQYYENMKKAQEAKNQVNDSEVTISDVPEAQMNEMKISDEQNFQSETINALEGEDPWLKQKKTEE